MSLDNMPVPKVKAGWILVAVLLVAIIAAGSLAIWSRQSRSQAIEITFSPDQELQGEIYIGGQVNNPGFYPLKAGDSIEDIIRAAGGLINGADLSQLELFVPDLIERDSLQKVNINKAEVWLLGALPGIGEVTARAIIDYRRQNGPFRNISELVEVEGIGTATYEKIKHLITIAD
jgi:competence protein ComEA